MYKLQAPPPKKKNKQNATTKRRSSLLVPPLFFLNKYWYFYSRKAIENRLLIRRLVFERLLYSEIGEFEKLRTLDIEYRISADISQVLFINLFSSCSLLWAIYLSYLSYCFLKLKYFYIYRLLAFSPSRYPKLWARFMLWVCWSSLAAYCRIVQRPTLHINPALFPHSARGFWALSSS